VLFDMDGVVIDTQLAVTELWERVAAQYQVELTQADFDTHIYGCPCAQTLDALFPHLSEDERAAVFAEEYAYETSLTYTPMSGVGDFLRALHENGVPTALVTSGERWKVAEVMRQIGIGNLFNAYVTAEDIPRGKPDPACYVLGAERLGVSTDRCIVFEDSISGVQAAIAAGMQCVGVRPTRMASALLAEGASWVIPHFESVRLEHGENSALAVHLMPDVTLWLNGH